MKSKKRKRIFVEIIDGTYPVINVHHLNDWIDDGVRTDKKVAAFDQSIADLWLPATSRLQWIDQKYFNLFSIGTIYEIFLWYFLFRQLSFLVDKIDGTYPLIDNRILSDPVGSDNFRQLDFIGSDGASSHRIRRRKLSERFGKMSDSDNRILSEVVGKSGDPIGSGGVSSTWAPLFLSQGAILQ